MDKNELKRQLIPFVEECERRGYPLSNLQVFDVAPGLETDRFYIRFITDWSRDRALEETGMFLWKILDESVPSDVSERI